MVYQYNDCFQLTRGYLRNLKSYVNCQQDLQKQLDELQDKIDADSICKKYQLKKDLDILTKHYARLKNALNLLTEKEKIIVYDFYYCGWTYVKLARVLNYSERSCRRRIQAITQKVSETLFDKSAIKNFYFVSKSSRLG